METNKELPELVVHLHRDPHRSAPGYSVGAFCLDECGYFCDSMEDEDRGLTKDMPLEQIKKIKVYGKTAIPKGRYPLRMDVVSPRLKDRAYAKKYGGCLPRLEGVPGWEGVLIHPFNTAEDSYGCIAPGVFVPGKARVKDSTKAFYDLMDCYLRPAHKRGQKIFIEID